MIDVGQFKMETKILWTNDFIIPIVWSFLLKTIMQTTRLRGGLL